MIKTNKSALVDISVGGEIVSPEWSGGLYQVDETGRTFILPGAGGIHYNIRVGDRAYGWMAAHPEPGVSVRHLKKESNSALNHLSCIGNEATVTSGEAQGETGIVVGKGSQIGFAEGLPQKHHLIIQFPESVLSRLGIGDKVLIHAFGRGLRIEGHPDVEVKNCSPKLLEALGLEESGDGELVVTVVVEIPSVMMGLGAGFYPEVGAQDIAVREARQRDELGLGDLRIGDIVALRDQDHRYGRAYKHGAITISVVSYGDSPVPGHGPGVTTLLTCPHDGLRVRFDKSANLVRYLNLEER